MNFAEKLQERMEEHSIQGGGDLLLLGRIAEEAVNQFCTDWALFYGVRDYEGRFDVKRYVEPDMPEDEGKWKQIRIVFSRAAQMRNAGIKEYSFKLISVPHLGPTVRALYTPDTSWHNNYIIFDVEKVNAPAFVRRHVESWFCAAIDRGEFDFERVSGSSETKPLASALL